MKVHLDCQSCLLEQGLQTARFCEAPPEVQERVMRRSLAMLADADWSLSPMELGTEVRRIAREETGVADPYIEVKERSNRLAMAQIEDVREKITASEDPLDVALAASIAGNVLDYGSRERFDLIETLATISSRRFAIDDRRSLREALESAESIGFLADNAGEIVFDRLLIETIHELMGPKKTVFVVRSEPFINDALTGDARSVGLTEVEGLRLLEMSPRIPPEGDRDWPTWRELMDCDVIISKGQGNYEAFSAVSGIYFLLMTKCAFVASDLGSLTGRELDVGEMILWRRP